MQNNIDSLDFASLNRDEVMQLLKQHRLNLTVDEALTIQNDLLKRPPTISECVLWSIQGSEHCSYKSTRKHLKQFNTKSANVILGAKEDAGIIAVAKDHAGRRYGIVMSHESHNHPSQIVPYEGAATGVGGNVRDVCCMGAEVIAIADGLRFGDLHRPKTHWIQSEVVAGIAGYGNPIGVPNIAGDVYFDSAYNDNCLVTVVTLGIVREDHIIHSYAPKDANDAVFILVGKPTDNSGFGGASFASGTLQEDQKEKNKGAVQEPNAFLQRHLLKANYALFKMLQEKNLIDRVGFKDLGAGGIACASVELAESSGFGAEIDLETVPVAMQHLPPYVVLCSETQERFMWIVPNDLVDLFLSHYNETFALPKISEGARAVVIGKLRSDGDYIVRFQNKEIVNAKACDVTKGIQYDRPYQSKAKQFLNPILLPPSNFNEVLLQLLAHENIASRAPIFEMYDKQVQGRTILEAGFADAGVMQPFNNEDYPPEIQLTGITLSLDQNPRYNHIDAYWGSVNAVIEAVRNVIAVGSYPHAITDCLCFGNPEKPEQMAEFVASIKGITDACRAIQLIDSTETLPIIAGNVSLYNESEHAAIPPSPMISCLGVIPDATKAISYDFKSNESLLFMVGERKDESGGSVYYQLHHVFGAQVPKPDLVNITQEIRAVYESIQQDLVLAAHDISDGGVTVAIAEMSFKNEIGCRVNIPGDLPADKKLFTETGGFLLEVNKDKAKKLREIFNSFNVPLFHIGETNAETRIQINSVIDLNLHEAKQVWLNGLRERLN